MKLREISDADKILLTVAGISYDFSIDFKNIEWLVLNAKGSSRRYMVKNTIGIMIQQIEDFLNYGFEDSDPDVLLAKEYHSKLSGFYKDFK